MQPSLNIDLPPAERSLSTVESLRDWLRMTHDQVMAAIESGVVPIAFDIRAPSADRCEIRLWHPNVEALVRSRGADSGPRLSPEKVVQLLVPGFVRTSTLERAWSVSHHHISSLVDSGCLPVAQARAAQAGPHSYSILEPQGVRSWLLSRVVI